MVLLVSAMEYVSRYYLPLSQFITILLGWSSISHCYPEVVILLQEY